MSDTVLKVGRHLYDINENDVVMFNGACWQLITRSIFSGWHSYPPTVSKVICEKFVKKGILVLYKKEREYTTAEGKQMGLYYYKFDINKLKDYLHREIAGNEKCKD